MKQELFMEKLNTILAALDFDEAARLEVLRYIPARYSFITRASREAYAAQTEQDPIMKKRHHTRLMVLMVKTVELFADYEEKGLPLDVMYDTLSDLTLRQRMYYSKYGKLGLSDEDVHWLRHIYNLTIFKLGSLQFEMAYMEPVAWKGSHYYEGAWQKVPLGTPILNVHIRRGVDFSKEAVDESFARAESFFKTFFPEHAFTAYTCNSWMLYPGNKKILPENSNILAFARRFELIGETSNPEFTLKFIFGGRYRAKVDYPQETSLQVKALQNPHALGAGFGILLRTS